MFCPFCAANIGSGEQKFLFCPHCAHELPLHPRYVAAGGGTDGGASATATTASIDDTVMSYERFLGMRKTKGDERRGFSKKQANKKLARNVKVQ
jgi:hypothetical protein